MMRLYAQLSVAYVAIVNRVLTSLRQLASDDDGATATEYVVLLVLVACFIIAVVSAFGEQIRRLYQQALDAVYFL